MFASIVIMLCFSVPITTFNINLMPAIESEHGKTYPGFTVFEKDGQFARFVGPLYAKLDVSDFKPPFQFWRQLNFSVTATPTVELFSLYINGEVLFERSPIFSIDGGEDQCIAAHLDCPYLPGVPVHKGGTLTLGDLGIFPGWYSGSFDMFTLNKKYKRYKIGRGEFKIKVVDT